MTSSLVGASFSGDVLWNLSSIGVLLVGGILINSIILGFRGDAALGVFNQAYAFYIILSQFAVGGLQHSVLKHVSYVQDDPEACADITSVALAMVIGITTPISLMGAVLAGSIGAALDSPDVGTGLGYVMPGLVFFAANKVLINALNGLRRMRVYAFFRALRFALIPTFIVALIATDSPTSSLPVALTLTEIILFVLLLVYIYYHKLLPIRLPRNIAYHVRTQLSYGMRGMMSGVLTELNTRVDILILGLFLSDRVVGLYSFAAILAEGFAQIPIAVRYNVDPLVGDYFSKQHHARVTELSRQIRHFFVPAMIAIGIASVLGYPLVYWLVAGTDGLLESWLVYVLLALTHVAIAGYSPMRGLLLQGGAPGTYTLIILAMIASNVVLNVLLIPLIGIFGSAIATSASLVLEIALIVIESRRRLGVVL